MNSKGRECNACQQYVIDTYKVVGESLVVIDSRDPNWGDYKRYEKTMSNIKEFK